MREDIYKSIYNAIEQGLYVFDKRGEIICVNPAAQKILGFKEEELVGKIGHNLFHAHALNGCVSLENCPIYKAFSKQKSFTGEEVICTKDGTLLTVEISCVCLENGEYLVLFRDISLRKKQEEEILSLASIVKETQDIVVVKDLDLRVIATNKAFATVVGKESPEELVGKTDAQIFEMDENKDPVKGYMEDERKAQTLPKGDSIDKEERVIRADGGVAVYKTRKFPIYNHEDKVIATANISVDITTQKEQEEALKSLLAKEKQKNSESDIFYTKIFETANLGICLTDKEGRFAVVNPAYCKIYGYSEQELIGEHFTKVVAEENRDLMRELHDTFIQGGQEEIPIEWDVVGKEGKKLHILATAGKLDNIVGGPFKIITITDMTEAHEARLLQKHQESLLIQQSKLASMGEMLGAIAHQWRQPLNVINCTTLDLHLKKQMGVLEDAYFSEAIAKLGEMTQSMSKTIDDFMNFFKPSKEKKHFSLHTSVEYAIHILSAQLKSHGVGVVNEVGKDVMVYGVKGELEQVILNLLSNARDAFEEKEVPVKEIRFYASPLKDGGVELIVEDTAGGIDEPLLGKIFDPYFTTKGDKQGTGIGLYMCVTIMEKTFRGSISAVNWYNNANLREGAKMLLRFPNKEY